MRSYTRTGYLLFVFFLFYGTNCQARIELLNTNSSFSHLAPKSIITSLANRSNNKVLAVGERGHILNWKSPGDYKQEISPVALLLTDVIILSDGTKLAVGHDGAIISAKENSMDWIKLFDGFELINLKIGLIKKRIRAFKKTIETITDTDALEEADFALEDLEFSLEDAGTAKISGPTLPLLSVTQTKNGSLIAVGAYGTLLKSLDLGKTWQLLDERLNNPDKYHLNSIITDENNSTYITGEQGKVYKSIDDGSTWKSINTPYNGSLFGILSHKESGNLITFGLKGNYFISKDQGEHWEHFISENRATLLAGFIKDNGDTILVGHGGTILSFNINKPEKTNLTKHSSAAALSAVTVLNDQLILAGQFGIISLNINEGIHH
jgi:photosystem II stability/assembly factor-like uncharacterized protein|tara:strand:+ start:21452 stop:22591 length:1140 start_codon:yes stop_codon:yes gene_type:complete